MERINGRNLEKEKRGMVEKGERKNKGDTWGQKPGKHQTARHKKQ